MIGLVGDSAAGKSTLMKVLSGAYTPDGGEIRLEGRPVRFDGPIAARDAGIEMIYQNYALVPALSVAENIFLGREKTRTRLGVTTIDRAAMNREAEAMFGRLGLRVPPVTNAVRTLSGGQQQAVAIARATAFSAKLVVMDEPTANLGASAIEKVRETVQRLKSQGVGVVLISHRLEDVFTVGDRMVVMKHGSVVGARNVSDTETSEIVQCFVMKISPAEVDVAVERLQAETGKAAILDGDGPSFAEIAEERLGMSPAIAADESAAA